MLVPVVCLVLGALIDPEYDSPSASWSELLLAFVVIHAFMILAYACETAAQKLGLIVARSLRPDLQSPVEKSFVIQYATFFRVAVWSFGALGVGKVIRSLFWRETKVENGLGFVAFALMLWSATKLVECIHRRRCK